ncbi:murein biosynthesis integral membrane protein MurJ [Aquihabitans sp. McL0605]|uniref:murein biosynthesis integral membrane protein MurJ n=1 Tax=Aquihabitans sp. McL0605 TaxID=3415671 RepID=UPI003CEDB644
MTAEADARVAVAPPPGLARSTVTMSVLTAVSRATGLVRIIMVGAVVGTTYLGNTYETTNTIPNIVFELMAAGTFQAVLIPALVRYESQGEKEEAEHVASSVFGIALVALFGVAAVGMLMSPWISQLLFSGSAEAVRAEQVRLGTIFLLIFLPQVGMYAVGMVSTAVLNSQNRFAAPAIAPAVNNVIVCTAYFLYWLSRDGGPPVLHLTPLQIALLAGGTTLGVIGFCAVPLLAVRRTSFRLRIKFDRHHPAVRQVLRMGVWAAGFLATTQLLILVELLLSNKVKGGVVALQIGWTFFLLPYALFAQPILTALFPTMSRQSTARDDGGFARSVESGTEMICLFVVPCAIAFVAVAPAMCRAILFGAINAAGAADVARVVVGFAPGVVGYSLLLFYARVFYAREDARTPTIVNLAAGVLGAVIMLGTSSIPSRQWQVPLLAAIHAFAYSLAAVALVLIIKRRLPQEHRPALLRRLRPQILAVAPVLVVGTLIGRQIPLHSRLEALVLGVVVGLGVMGLYALLTAALGGPKPRALLGALKRGGH